jgi:mono/diheme cytochrome c family protein
LADAGGPYSGVAGETAVVFDGSGSSDPENDTLDYQWNFGDSIGTGTGVAPTYVYPAAGSYTVTLVVSDANSSSDPATAVVEITAPVVNLPPVAVPGGPYTGEPGVAVAFDGSGSSDPNGDALTFAWDFGDSTTGSGPTPSHIYDTIGEYTVSLTVNDGESDSLIATTTATIAVPPANSPPAPGSGASLYATYCFGCHADPWDGPAVDDALAGKRRVAGARSCNIEGSIFGTSVFPDGAPGMQALQVLTDDEVQSLAEYLNSEPTSGERRYVTTCAGCHGNSGEGGRVDEDVHGESAHETWEAIREDSEMRYLACMPEDDIHAIADYLAGQDDDYDDDGISDDEDEDDDNDGVSDEDEYEDGTDPRDHDTDDDGLSDGEEKEHGCDPKDPDTDDDGKSDGAEVHTLGTNPLVADSFDSQPRSGGGAPGIPALLFLLMIGLARRAYRQVA